MTEIYKDIPGYEGKYQISNMGNVKSLHYKNTNKEKVLTPINHYLGYQFVHLGVSKIKMIHVLVAENFVPNKENKPFVNHIDGNKKNNKANNLEWVTAKENMQHAIRTGLRNPHENGKLSGGKNPTSKHVYQFSLDGEYIAKWDCISSAARFYNVRPGNISNCAAGRKPTCGGFIWKYDI